MKKRILICLLCQILLFTNIGSALTFKAYAADEIVSSDYLEEVDDIILSEELIDESYSESDGNDSVLLAVSTKEVSTAEEMEMGLDHSEGVDNDAIHVHYDRNSFHYEENGEEPDDVAITEAEYLTSFEKDKDDNGVFDILEENDEVQAAAMPTGILGDLNGDEYVDNKDVILLYRHLAGWSQDINDEILDLNGDGYINTKDASHLMKYVSGWTGVVLYEGKINDIVYHLCTEGTYIDPEKIDNTRNQNYYYSSKGWTLKEIQADGYIFEGWYDGQGQNANRITKIPVGETGEIELYARWSPAVYEISFESPLSEVAKKYYTIETGSTLTNPSFSNYIFVGWTNQENGQFIKNIPKGSFGNVTLVANWASRRNLAKPVQQLGDPIIAEDSVNGKIYFLYRLGDIENIPLFTLYRFSTAQGMSSSVTITEQTSISTSDAKTISEAIANATTDSATWTLSEGWNDITSVSQESLKQSGVTREEAETTSKSSSNTYRLDTSVSESEVIVDSSQYAFKGSSGIGTTQGHTTESGGNYSYSVDEGYEVGSSVGGTIGSDKVAQVKTEINASQSLNIGEEYGVYSKNSGTTTNSWNATLEEAGQAAKSQTSTKNWNTNSSYSNSNSISNSYTTSEQISEIISDRYGYGKSYSKNGAHSSGQAFTTQNSQQSSYSNTVTYDTSTLYTKEVTFSTDGKIDGYYRQVLAGTAHVFGVVGYDIATCSYFVYSFSVMDDETYEFLDYSKNSASFNDNEISVLPFEIPVFVNEYVNAKIARSKGLEININTGKVTGYTGDETIVIIPSYVDISNGDGTSSSIKIVGIEADAFKGNKTIQGVMFSEFITDIPDSAFEDCTSLQDIYVPNLTTIGNRAFYGCSSLSKLTIPEYVESIGADAFYNVPEVEVIAANKAVALSGVHSGAKSLTLNISNVNEEMSNTELEIPSGTDVFELQGARKEYSNLRVKSFAESTKINGINFVESLQVPLELHSSFVGLNQTTVTGSGYCMILANNNCELSLFGSNKMYSTGENAIVCGNTTLSNSDSSVQAMLEVNGNIYVCGSVSNEDRYLNQTKGNIIYITQDEYDKYINGVYQLRFDANGGSVAENERTAYSGASIGELPNPSRTGYTFVGWYTALSGGTQVTASSTFISSDYIVVYALWSPINITVTFNGNGGTPGTPSKTVSYDSTYGNLPTASRTGYTLSGWYTEASGGTKVEPSTVVKTTVNHTLYAHWTANEYTVTYNGNGGTPGAANKKVKFDSNYGTLATANQTGYTFSGWYTSASGGTKIESTTKVSTASNHTLYAHWTPNSYTYNIVYKSSNDYNLGSSTATYKFGTTNTITAPNKPGYNTPGSQSVKWDATSKTITFVYPPSPVGYTTNSGMLSNAPDISYYIEIQYQNRTADSVEVRVYWENTIYAYNYNTYQMRISGSCNGAGIPDTEVVPFGAWRSSASYDRGSAGTSPWIRVGLNTTGQTSVSAHLEMYQYNSQGTNMFNYNGTSRAIVDLSVAIPAF